LKISRVFARRIVRKRQSLTCDEVIRHDVWFGEIRRRAFTGKRFELFYKMRLIVIAAIERGLHEIPVVLSSLEHSQDTLKSDYPAQQLWGKSNSIVEFPVEAF